VIGGRNEPEFRTTAIINIKNFSENLMSQTHTVLDQSEIPAHRYNIAADLRNPPSPPPNPILEQEMSASKPGSRSRNSAGIST
jgi:hypothetical protein